MNHYLFIAVLLTVVLIGHATADEPAASDLTVTEEPLLPLNETVPEKQDRISDHMRDPFSTTPSMKQLAGHVKLPTAEVNVATTRPVKMPSVKVKGRVADGERPSVALLEFSQSGTQVVRPGEVLSMVSDGAIVNLRVREISTSGVLLEVIETGDVLLIR